MEQTDEHEDEEDAARELEVASGVQRGLHRGHSCEHALRLVLALRQQQQQATNQSQVPAKHTKHAMPPAFSSRVVQLIRIASLGT